MLGGAGARMQTATGEAAGRLLACRMAAGAGLPDGDAGWWALGWVVSWLLTTAPVHPAPMLRAAAPSDAPCALRRDSSRHARGQRCPLPPPLPPWPMTQASIRAAARRSRQGCACCCPTQMRPCWQWTTAPRVGSCRAARPARTCSACMRGTCCCLCLRPAVASQVHFSFPSLVLLLLLLLLAGASR